MYFGKRDGLFLFVNFQPIVGIDKIFTSITYTIIESHFVPHASYDRLVTFNHYDDILKIYLDHDGGSVALRSEGPPWWP